MTVAAKPRLTSLDVFAMIPSYLRDQRHRQTRPGAAVIAYLAWKENEDGAAERTLDSYERDLARLCRFYPDTPAEALRTDDYRAIIATYPVKSRRKVTAVFKDFSRWLYQEGRSDSDEMGRVRYPKRKTRTYIDTFTAAEVEALLGLDIRDGALMHLLLDAGLRKAEARNLRLLDCKLGRRELIVLDGKGRKDRIVPMSGRLVQAVSDLALIEGIDQGHFLWYGVKANARSSRVLPRTAPIGEGTFHRWWARCCETAGVTYVPRTRTSKGRGNPHVARHTFALRWLRGLVGREEPGRPGRIETLSRVMGHESIRTTVDLYGHLDVSDAAADLAAMEAGGIIP